MEDKFTTAERKKEADKIFKEKILPFFENYSFQRHTKTSKRLFKNLDNGLLVFLFFEYKNRFGCYDMTIAYFDDEFGNVYDDEYLAMSGSGIPSYSGDNSKSLQLAIDDWLTDLKSKIIPLLDKHSNHKSILESDYFTISSAREESITDFLKSKSNG